MKNKIVFLLFIFSLQSMAQQTSFLPSNELQEFIKAALKNNKELQSYALKTEAAKANIGTALDFGKTGLYYSFDENNQAPNDRALRVWGVEQSFSFPTVYAAQRKIYQSEWKQSEAEYQLIRNELILNVSLMYNQIVYIQNKELLYNRLDSLYSNFSNAEKRRFELGEANYLEKITAEAKAKQIHTSLIQIRSQKEGLSEQLKALIQTEELEVDNKELAPIHLNEPELGKSLQQDYLQTISETFTRKLRLQDNNWLPDFNVELFSGTNKTLGYRMNGFRVGIAIPLFFNGNVSKRKALKYEKESWEAMKKNQETVMDKFYKEKQTELNQFKEVMKYYNEIGNHLAKEILKTADMSFKNGEIDFFQYIQSLDNAISIEVDYLDNLMAYNKSYLELHYFNFKQL